MKSIAAVVLAAVSFAAAPALCASAAPQPTKPVPTALYSGRWYEVARTPNKMQSDCQGATNDFSDWSRGDFSVVQTCHKGAPNGPAQVMKVTGQVLPSSANAKMKLGILGGLLSREYWILDRADNNDWAIMDRADGRYVWLLSRQPNLSAADRAAALSRLQSLGFQVNKLAFVQP
ncbi:MAG TPA: lipocalin family protein [Caulobacteraceae bacterium]|nr:lipocalin family protein [Caulobacteraceae bacterium]